MNRQITLSWKTTKIGKSLTPKTMWFLIKASLNNDKCFREATYQKLASKSNIDEPLLRSLRPTVGLLHLFLNAPLEVWGNSVAYYGVPSVKLFHGQKWILYVIRWYSFMLHSKIFALYPNPSTIWAIVYVICLHSLMLHANLCVTCGTWYVACSVLYAMCPDSFMIFPFCYVACLKPFMLCLKIRLYASIHS